MEKAMSVVLALASLAILAVAATHSILGEIKLIGLLVAPATRAGLLAKSEFARQVLRFAWHLTTIAWIALAGELAVVASGSDARRGALVVCALAFLETGLVTFAASRGRHLAWPAFLLIAALSAAPLL
jgi:hypothetical protein